MSLNNPPLGLAAMGHLVIYRDFRAVLLVSAMTLPG
jgi:hypothetical protein